MKQKTEISAIVAKEMIERLDHIRIQPHHVLNLGSDSSAGLKNLYSEAEIIEIELEKLAELKTESIDLIFSNFALASIQGLDSIFQIFHRILKPNGLLMFSTFGPDTQLELKQGHIFFDMHDIGDGLVRQQFLAPVMDRENICLDNTMFEVIYGHAWRGEIKQTQKEDGEVWIPLKRLKYRH